jgi:flagellar basal body L-ring protein FlgH
VHHGAADQRSSTDERAPRYRPDALAASLAATGSIYQAGASRTLFEDRRARYVGDTITVTITENTSAATKSNSNVSKTGSISASLGPNLNLPGKLLTELKAKQQQHRQPARVMRQPTTCLPGPSR